jgi:hypothetical protein
MLWISNKPKRLLRTEAHGASGHTEQEEESLERKAKTAQLFKAFSINLLVKTRRL